MSSRRTILEKLKKSLGNRTRDEADALPDLPAVDDLFKADDTPLDIMFAREFTALGGDFIHAIDEADAMKKLSALMAMHNWEKVFCRDKAVFDFLERQHIILQKNTTLADCQVSITTCLLLVARTGSIAMNTQQSDRTSAIYAPHHICLAYTDQLRYDIRDALAVLDRDRVDGTLPSLFSLVSGPSKTADIEKTLVRGVHGPKNVYVVLIDQRA